MISDLAGFVRFGKGAALSALLLAGLCAAPAWAESDVQSPRVCILLTDAEVYQQMASLVQRALANKGRTCKLIKFAQGTATEPAAENAGKEAVADEARDALAQLRTANPSIVVTVGSRATTVAATANLDMPILYCLVPNALDQKFDSEKEVIASKLMGLTTDVRPKDQLERLRRLSPGVKVISVLHGPRSKRSVEALARAAERAGCSLIAIPTQHDRFGEALQELNARPCDAVVMLPDADVYNSANMQQLLLWGLRGKKPVWAFSANLVKAGAFAGVYADSGSMATQTANLVQALLDGKKFKESVIYPDKLQCAVNERTAELIEISLDGAAREMVDVRFGEK